MQHLNRARTLIQKLHSYCLCKCEYILELLANPGYMCVVEKDTNVEKYHTKLLKLHQSVENGVAYNIAVDSIFSKDELEYFEHSISINLEQCLSDLEAVTVYDEPITKLLKSKSSIDFAYSALKSGDMTRLHFAELLASKQIDVYVNVILETAMQEKPKSFEESIDDMVSRYLNVTPKAPITTDCEAINRIFEHLPPHGFVVLAARTNVGKTYLSTYYALNACKRGKVVYISLEMGSDSILIRYLSLHYGVNAKSIDSVFRTHDPVLVEYIDPITGMVKKEALSVADIRSTPHANNLTVIDLKQDRSVKKIISIIMKYVKMGVEEFIIDYIQNINPNAGVNGETAAVSDLCSQLQSICDTKKVKIIGCSQISRISPYNERPQLIHMKSSSGIENSADAVMILHRYESHSKKEPQVQYVLNPPKALEHLFPQHLSLFLAKNRNGQVGIEEEFGFSGIFPMISDIDTHSSSLLSKCFAPNNITESDDEDDENFYAPTKRPSQLARFKTQ